MWRWVSASRRPRGLAVPRAGGLSLLVAALASSLLAFPAAAARELVTLDEALSAAVPGATSRQEQVLFLEQKDLEAIEKEAGSRPASRLQKRILLRGEGGRLLAAAYLDSHIVRTLAERLLIVVGAEGRVKTVVVLGFDEPPEYLPSARWYAQFEGRALDRRLRLKQQIRTLAGATLSSRAATAAARRALALHALRPPSAEAGP